MKEKYKSVNSSWNFKQDKVHLFAFWKNAFTKEECEKIIEIANNKGLV